MEVERSDENENMKRTNNAATPPSIVSSPNGSQATEKQSSAENGALEEHRVRMSRGEIIFYLRDVHRYWSTPRISHHEIEELEQENLIERRITGICAIRLTEQGERVKNWQQRKAA